MSQTTQGGPERLKVSISMGETAITLFGVNTRDYYFDSGVMADVEARFWERFQPDGAGISLTLRGMAEAMGSPSPTCAMPPFDAAGPEARGRV